MGGAEAESYDFVLYVRRGEHMPLPHRLPLNDAPSALCQMAMKMAWDLQLNDENVIWLAQSEYERNSLRHTWASVTQLDAAVKAQPCAQPVLSPPSRPLTSSQFPRSLFSVIWFIVTHLLSLFVPHDCKKDLLYLPKYNSTCNIFPPSLRVVVPHRIVGSRKSSFGPDSRYRTTCTKG